MCELAELESPLVEDNILVLSFSRKRYSALLTWLDKNHEATYFDRQEQEEHLWSVGIEFIDDNPLPPDLKIILDHCNKQEASYFRFIAE